ncbi:lysis protein [Actinophytocola xinjiangensis]|uniref:Lysis protein n=1 Tax=Actinophytocola xinjiangensis TaxID=485602 RepID=A0A7Z1B018_9PSEU|nr:C39 family peptidase [Actinophytocola xinjiangensis]OLF11981.1 lysis protein [Actinophytocola xinjiangensis]
MSRTRPLAAAAIAVALVVPPLVLAPVSVAEPRPAPVAPSAKPATVTPAGEHVLQVDYQVQETGYWCGPAATRIALSARGVYRSQASLAAELGTHTGGTDWIGQVTRVLGGYVGWYETKEMPNDPPTQAQKDLLWRDIVLDIDNGYPIVANIVAPPGNQPPGYPPGQTIYHYFTVIGYNDVNRTVLIADPASFSGNQIYWLTFDQLASLIPPKGYSA